MFLRGRHEYSVVSGILRCDLFFWFLCDEHKMKLVSDFEKEKDVLVILQPELGAHSLM